MIHIPNKINKDSWLHDDRHKWFVEGYYYAMTQTMAIPTLAKVTPEELYQAVVSIIRGANLENMEIPKL